LTPAGEAYEPVWQTTDRLAVNNGVAAKSVNYPIEQIMISLIGAAIKALCRSKPRDFATKLSSGDQLHGECLMSVYSATLCVD